MLGLAFGLREHDCDVHLQLPACLLRAGAVGTLPGTDPSAAHCRAFDWNQFRENQEFVCMEHFAIA